MSETPPPLLAWRPEFALGIPGVDEEHRELIELINALHADLAGRDLSSPTGQESVAAFLGEIHARIAAHFALEEREMRERGYDRYAEHKGDHERLLEEIHALIEDYDAGRVVHLDDFSRSLDAWFTDHFRDQDARLHRALG